MSLDEFIISVYVYVDDFFKPLGSLRQRGPSPHLSDAEVVTMEIVGKFLALGSDKQIFQYFKNHWGSLVPQAYKSPNFCYPISWFISSKRGISSGPYPWNSSSQRYFSQRWFSYPNLPCQTCTKKESSIWGSFFWLLCSQRRTLFWI